MKRTFASLLIFAALASAPGVAGATWSQLVDEAAMSAAATAATLTPKTDYDVTIVATSPDGRYVVFADSDTGTAGANFTYLYAYDKISSTLGVISTSQAIRTAIVALNSDVAGTTDFRIQAIDVSANGTVVMYVVETSTFNFESLVGVPVTGGAVSVYVTDTTVNATNDTPLNGIGGVACVGNHAYLTRVASFAGGGTDDIWDVNLLEGASPGLFTLATAITDIVSVVAGDTGSETNRRPSDIARWDATSVVVSDSATSNTSDDFILIGNLTTAATKTLFVDAGDIQTDIGGTDLGYSAHVKGQGNTLFALNKFGAGTGDDAIIRLNAPGGGVSTASVFQTEVEVGTGIGGTIDLNSVAARNIAFDTANNRLVFSANVEGTAEGIFEFNFNSVPASVSNWELFQ